LGVFKGNWVSNSTSGTAGSITYYKSITCNRTAGLLRDVDVNGDGLVTNEDVTAIQDLYGNVSTDSTFNETYDINCDNKLNVIEIGREGFEFNTR